MELFVNSNDNSNEGLIHKEKPFFQFNFILKHVLVQQILLFLFKYLLKDVKVEFNVKERIYEIVNNSLKDSIKLCKKMLKIKLKKILILGSGGLSIGQAGEFDYSGSQAIKAF